MVRLHHRFRKDGGVNVRGTWYELDKSGCIEVTEQHAAILLQGAMWSVVDRIAAPVPLPPPPPAPSSAQHEPEAVVEATGAEEPKLEDMSRAQLGELARSLGVKADGRTAKLKLVSLIREAKKDKEA